MARKSFNSLSPDYRRRLQRAGITAAQYRAGASLQKARGHKAREHVIRRERETREAETLGKLTTGEKSYVRTWARVFAYETGQADDEDEVIEEAIEYATRAGYARFRELVERKKALRRQYKAMRRAGTWESLGMGFLEALGAEFGCDPRWLYYH